MNKPHPYLFLNELFLSGTNNCLTNAGVASRGQPGGDEETHLSVVLPTMSSGGGGGLHCFAPGPPGTQLRKWTFVETQNHKQENIWYKSKPCIHYGYLHCQFPFLKRQLCVSLRVITEFFKKFNAIDNLGCEIREGAILTCAGTGRPMGLCCTHCILKQTGTSLVQGHIRCWVGSSWSSGLLESALAAILAPPPLWTSMPPSQPASPRNSLPLALPLPRL